MLSSLTALTGWETNNQYVVKNSLGQQVFFAAEESDFCTRMVCGSVRSFLLHIQDNMGRKWWLYPAPLTAVVVAFLAVCKRYSTTWPLHHSYCFMHISPKFCILLCIPVYPQQIKRISDYKYWKNIYVAVLACQYCLIYFSWRFKVPRAAQLVMLYKAGILSCRSSPSRMREKNLFWRLWGRSVTANVVLMLIWGMVHTLYHKLYCHVQNIIM